MTVAPSPRWDRPADRVPPRARDALSRVRPLIRELASFGAVGLLAFVVDVGGYNLLRATVMPDAVVGAKVVSVAVATLVAYVGHRGLTFRSRTGRSTPGELLLFVVANAGGLGVAAATLYVSHYLLGFTSTVADNIAGNVVGLVLGTAFRYVAYRYLVFRPQKEVSQ